MRFLRIVGASVCSPGSPLAAAAGKSWFVRRKWKSASRYSEPSGGIWCCWHSNFLNHSVRKDCKSKIVLKDKGGAPVKNTIVTFSETGGGLLKFSPDSKTALTNTNGEAEIDIEPVSTTSIGATSVVRFTTSIQWSCDRCSEFGCY